MWIKNFLNFQESLVINIDNSKFDLNESLRILLNTLLKSIDAEKVNIYDVLKLPNDFTIDLQYLDNSDTFIKILSKNGMKKSNMEITSDYETFIDTPCRFIFIYDKKASDLDNPIYLLIQELENNIWTKTEIFKVKNDIKKFYDKLSSKIIEINDDNNKFIYETGDLNNWTLKSVKETEFYKRNMTKEELENIIKSRNATITII